ncbi:BrnT family toxin, partial [Methylobacterium frigidaeris]|uniref:BrnT family toxin n=1 Tax=Methylobacterium frigidaeris TaxID=2038277 RepID=UPI001FD39ED4
MVWDEPERESNIRKHRMDFADARDRFEWVDSRVAAAEPAPDGRPRFLAVGASSTGSSYPWSSPASAARPSRSSSLRRASR